MTAIAYKNGVLAADSLVSGGNMKLGESVKIWRRADGAIAGASGRSDRCLKFRAAFLADTLNADWHIVREKDDEISLGAVVIMPAGTITEYDERGGDPAPSAGFYAYGSAYAFLMGAMAAGASAPEAVMLAMTHCTDCGGHLTILVLQKEP